MLSVSIIDHGKRVLVLDKGFLFFMTMDAFCYFSNKKLHIILHYFRKINLKAMHLSNIVTVIGQVYQNWEH